MQIVVGSKNPLKINATQQVFSRFFPESEIKIKGIQIKSNFTDQPISMQEIIAGCRNRAKLAKDYVKKHGLTCDYSVGIEAGLTCVLNNEQLYLNYQFCVIMDSKDQEGIGSGAGFQLPDKIVHELIQKSDDLELADIMAQVSGNSRIKHQEGAVGYYSNEKITRFDLTCQSIEMALIPFLCPQSFF